MLRNYTGELLRHCEQEHAVVSEKCVEACRSWWDNCGMTTFNLDLFFIDGGKQSPSIANIYVKSCGGQEYGSGQLHKIISSQCLSAGELNREIDRLHAELEALRSQGEKMFSKAKAA
jgi:hypothetical protein